ncbi:MAG: iron uptake porin [Nostoc sp. LLA-1]|nr:iron uptake porin [Cyanocohniella sp. LLY]
MTKLFWNVLKVSPVVAATFLAANSALAVEVNEQVTTVAQLSQEADSIGQVTSVSQFADVQPTDWAFQALQSLVERYGCIAGYPDSTYRGNRALTRYEFAAGLNACLDRVNELIATATADVVTRQDLETLQRLQEEFSAELATLRGRVDSLEARTSELEANQFSTTTKLSGEAIFAVSDVFGDGRAIPVGESTQGLNSNTTFSNRVRLTLNTSFTGQDRLQTRLNSGNIVSTRGNDALGTGTGTNMTRLGFDGDNGNNVEIDKVNYRFNFSDALRVQIDATGAELNENVNVFNPDFSSSGRGAISRFGRYSPIYRQGAGGSGLTVTFNPGGALSLSGAYLAPRGNNPDPDNGVLEGANTVFGQLSFQPSTALNLGLAYARTYQNSAPTGSGINNFASIGSTFANNPFNGNATVANHYGLQASFQPSPSLALSGWVGYTTADEQVGAGRDADIWNWATTLAVRDLGREGNVLGLVFGQPPKVTGGSVDRAGRDNDTSYHLEGLYKIRVSSNVQVTPGLLVIFNPEHNSNNDTIYVGTLRTTFSF